MTAERSHASPVQDSETLKALEIANIRLKAAEEREKLLIDRLTAKDAIIEAQKGIIDVRDQQLALAKTMDKNSQKIETIDQFRVEACQQQLLRADAEIARLRNPGFFRSVFDPKTLTGAMVGFGLGRATK